MNKKKYISIIGGAGHVGLPLGIMLAKKNFKVFLVDKDKKNIQKVKKGIMPFFEENSQNLLKDLLVKKKIFVSNNLDKISLSKYIIVCIGTPVDKKNKPITKNFLTLMQNLKKILKKDQYLIIRSSVYPGMMKKIFKIFSSNNSKFENISYCPERILQGQSLKELPNLPQIISYKNNSTKKNVSQLFSKICKIIIYSSPEEAELIKLFSNVYRYINFAIANEFYMIAQNLGINFSSLRSKMIKKYKRNNFFPKAGFTAGPCLSKDTSQLNFSSKFNNLGKASLNVNEGMPEYIFNMLKKNNNLKKKTVGILGYTFKKNVDDIRDSLALKLEEILKKKKVKVIKSDYLHKEKGDLTTKKLIKKSDIIIIGSPHDKYKMLKLNKDKVLINIWD
jgi:UDP-N-acetyl-D-mannosaminuronic acid dehydrogenase